MNPTTAETLFGLESGLGTEQRSFEQTVLERRATAHFDDTPVPEAVVTAILHAASHAPSGYNLQPWRFLVLRDPKNRAKLRQVAYDQAKIAEAPVVIIAFAPHEAWQARMDEVFAQAVKRGAMPEGDREQRKKQIIAAVNAITQPAWLNRHVMIAFTHMMLAAEALGWDTAPMEGFDPAAVRRSFNLPEKSEVIALLAIGRARQPDRIFPGRLDLQDIAYAEDLQHRWSHNAHHAPS